MISNEEQISFTSEYFSSPSSFPTPPTPYAEENKVTSSPYFEFEETPLTPTIIKIQKVQSELPSLLQILPSQSKYFQDTTTINPQCQSGHNHEILSEEDSNCEDETWGNDLDLHFVTDLNGKDYLKSEDDRGRRIFVDLNTGEVKYNLCLTLRKRNWMKDYPKGLLKKFLTEKKNKLSRRSDISSIDIDKSILGKDVVNSIKSSLEKSNQDEKWGCETLEPNHNSKQYQDSIKLSKFKSCNSIKFDKEDLIKMKVMFQLDKKFIVGKCLRNSNELIVLFDQHAAHERVRVETLTKEAYDEQKNIKSYPIAPPIQLNFTETEVMMLQSYIETFKSVGATVQISSPTCVKVFSAPLAFFERVATESIPNREPTMKNLLSSLLQEQVQRIIETKGSNLNSVPKTIFNIIASKACRGAIKFGQELTKEDCEELITRLKECKTPFQCAHGRPSMIPLVNLQSIKERTDQPFERCEYEEVNLILSQNQNSTRIQSEYFNNLSSGYFNDEDDDLFRNLTEY